MGLTPSTIWPEFGRLLQHLFHSVFAAQKYTPHIHMVRHVKFIKRGLVHLAESSLGFKTNRCVVDQAVGGVSRY